jgi:predicted ATPase
VIASVTFRNFKALRNAQVQLGAFNVILGPNGSGKTSLIESLLHLRALSKLPPAEGDAIPGSGSGPELTFGFSAPYEELSVRLGCTDEVACNALYLTPAHAPAWPELARRLASIRSFTFDQTEMAKAAEPDAIELTSAGGNLGSVLAHLRERDLQGFAALSAEFVRLFPECSGLEVHTEPSGLISVSLRLAGEGGRVAAGDMSQGMLYTLGLLTLSFSSSPPLIICLEEVDRGIHPRMLRDIRDAMYRLSYPESAGLSRSPVQVIVTTHSPYFVDLFRDHPEEIVVSEKHGTSAGFRRLVDRPDLPELLKEGSLGDLWYSGILGGVPES